MSERRNYPQRREKRGAEAEQQPAKVEWSRLIEEALTLPGSLGNTYNRFYEYSFTNQVLLYMQGACEPVATYNRWQELGRQVKRGAKAKAILRPIFVKEHDEDSGEIVQKLKGFKSVRCIFEVSDTEGEPLPPYEPREWHPEKALEALEITEVPFREINGNIAGYSYQRNLAISPVAPYPLKTLLHEMAHIVCGHTEPSRQDEYQQHRGLMEFEAEASAYLAMNEMGALEHMNASESRGYVQHWLRGNKPPDESIKRVFTTVDKIMKAGR